MYCDHVHISGLGSCTVHDFGGKTVDEVASFVTMLGLNFKFAIYTKFTFSWICLSLDVTTGKKYSMVITIVVVWSLG